MKRIFIIGLFIFAAFASVSAQSGRKITATPTPMPKTVEETVYSESKPNNGSTRIMPPNMQKKETLQDKAQKTTQTSDSTTDADDEVIKVETSLITIPVSVFDRNGLYIPGLKQENFKIFENGIEQE
ncbi:MAG TPA: hypothetical protein PKE69_26705, partial [Pyrinomonadaceae bacterium]|nr:hypothetical protein [Pyrinomonadaceae bacterium]